MVYKQLIYHSCCTLCRFQVLIPNNWTCESNELKMNSICCYQRRLKNFNWWITNCSWPGTCTHTPITHANIRTWRRIQSIRNKLWHIAMLGLGFRGMQKSGRVGNNSPTDKWCWVRVARSLAQAIEFLYFGQSSWCCDVMSTPWGGGGREGGSGFKVSWNECAGIPTVDSIVSSFDVARQAKYVAKMSLRE